MNHWNHFLFAATALGAACAVSACTPAIREQTSTEWHNIKTFSYGSTLAQFSGLDRVFKSNETKVQEVDNRLCLDTRSEQRIIRSNGSEDVYNYQRCLLQDYPTVNPQRLTHPPKQAS